MFMLTFPSIMFASRGTRKAILHHTVSGTYTGIKYRKIENMVIKCTGMEILTICRKGSPEIMV